MSNRTAKKTRIVILGAGFGGTYTFKYLHRYFHNSRDIELVLVNRTNYFLFTPLLHEVATGGVAPEHIVEPLRKVLGCCLADFHLTDILGVSLAKQCVVTASGDVAFDYLVLALGSTTNFFNVPGAETHSFTLKSLQDATRLKNHFIQNFEIAEKTNAVKEQQKLLHFVVVGGGPTGVEMAAEMSEFFYTTFAKRFGKSQLVAKARITLIQKSDQLLPNFSQSVQQKSHTLLSQKNITVVLGRQVVRVGSDFIALDNDRILPTKTVVWVAGVKPQPVAFDRDVPHDESGRLLTNANLQLQGFPNIFTLGDVAHVEDPKTFHVHPALAQVATKEGKLVAKNIRHSILGKQCVPFHYKHTGSLISLGRWTAIGEIHLAAFGSKRSLSFGGAFTWWLYRTVYLTKLLSWSKKVKVAIDWTVNIFSPRDISQVS